MDLTAEDVKKAYAAYLIEQAEKEGDAGVADHGKMIAFLASPEAVIAHMEQHIGDRKQDFFRTVSGDG